jgi:hypothetical protein
MRSAATLAALLALSTPARADRAAGWSWGAVPFANFDADAGYGIGGVGTIAWHRPGFAPYRAQLFAQLFVTSERVQAHELRADVPGAGHPRLRLSARAGYFATVNRNYCGLGNAVDCDPAVAVAAADAAGLAAGTDERADFVRRYYRVRFVNPYLHPAARWRLDGRGALSAFAGWRLAWYRSGTLGDRGPYPGSLYESDHPDGEPGWISLPLAGLLYDTRDSETLPSRGVFVETSLHATAPALGSSWSFGGGNLTTRVYHRLTGRLVSATRLIADGTLGDPPVAELGLIDATETYVGFGGSVVGRGIREHRYVGRVRLIAQQELRLDLSRRWVGVGFADAGWIAVDWTDVGGDPDRVLWTAGAGLRYVSSPTFILRADLGLSPSEDFAPQLYLYLGHLY